MGNSPPDHARFDVQGTEAPCQNSSAGARPSGNSPAAHSDIGSRPKQEQQTRIVTKAVSTSERNHQHS